MKIRFTTIVSMAAILTMTVSARGAELRLRQQCSPQTSLVTLGDIAEIFAADTNEADSLKRIELFPAPASDQPRVLRVRELQDILTLRSVNLTEHRFSGSSQVQIVSDKKRSIADLPLSEQSSKRAQRRVQEAILKYLQEQSGSNPPRNLQFDLTAAQQRTVFSSSLPLAIRGGASPWVGEQHCMVSVVSAEGSTTFPLDVRVSVPSMVVAAVHALPRGAIIHEADLTLVHGDLQNDGENVVFHSFEEAVGKQATKMIAEGKVLTPDAVQSPLMVRKNDVVTVYAKTAGIRIHITARAKDDGSLGDLVTVESMSDRKSFTARVSGPRETEVFAQAAMAE